MTTNQNSTQRRQAAKTQRKTFARKTFASLRLCDFALSLIKAIKYTRCTDLERSHSDVLIRSDLRDFLASRYAADLFNAKTPRREDAKERLGGIKTFASLRLCGFALNPIRATNQ